MRVALAECFAECEETLSVVAFRSRYTARNIVVPSYSVSPASFARAIVEFVRENPTRVVLPTMDGSIAALASSREQLAELGCVLALPSQQALAIANDKVRTLDLAHRLNISYPKTMSVGSIEEVPAVLAEFEFPFVVKPSVSWARRSGIRLQPVDVINSQEATTAIGRFLAAGVDVLAQQWASGRREGVSMFVVDGQVMAHCAHVAYRTTPALGGASVMRKSLPVADDIYAAAVKLVRAIGLDGVCEVEFRRDESDRPLLMEINARLAGTIENAMRSGVDFPRMIWDWATGQPVTGIDSYETGVRTRWLRGDMRWLRDNYLRRGRPDSVSRARAFWIFSSEFVRTMHYDCFDRHDLSPTVAELRNTAAAVRRSGWAKT